jgi:hypothetical protein
MIKVKNMSLNDLTREEAQDLLDYFLNSDRGIVIVMRALALSLKVMQSDLFSGDPEIVKDMKDMRIILGLLDILMSDDMPKDKERIQQTLSKLFPNENWSDL